ncbi:MAG: hypothetical protein ACR2J9_08520 [Gaiellales bacterium]
MTVVHPRLSTRRSAAVAFALLAIALAAILPARSQAAISKPTTSFYWLGNTAPVSGLKITGWDGKTVLVSVRASAGQVSIPTKATTGLTLAYGYSSWTGSDIVFTGPVANANTALAALTTVQPNAPYDISNRVSLSLMVTQSDASLAYYPNNDHFYKYIAIGPCTIDTDSGCTTDEQTARNPETAKAAAEASTALGQTGYLASITSAGENDFVGSKIQGATAVIIGGRDADEEGTWKWVGGPDNGVAFWRGCSATHASNPGTALGFAQWSTGEPNNFINNTDKCGNGNQTQIGEDCMVTNWTDNSTAETVGYWNDVPCGNNAYTARRVRGYVVEYGNLPTGGAYTGVDRLTTNLTPRPYANPKKIIPNFFKNVFAKLFQSKKRTPIKNANKQPTTFTYITRLKFTNPGTYVVAIKRADGKGSPYQMLKGTKVQTMDGGEVQDAVVLKSNEWKTTVTIKEPNGRLNLKPILKTDNWDKKPGTETVVQLKNSSNQKCQLGWCQGSPIPAK